MTGAPFTYAVVTTRAPDRSCTKAGGHSAAVSWGAAGSTTFSDNSAFVRGLRPESYSTTTVSEEEPSTGWSQHGMSLESWEG